MAHPADKDHLGAAFRAGDSSQEIPQIDRIADKTNPRLPVSARHGRQERDLEVAFELGVGAGEASADCHRQSASQLIEFGVLAGKTVEEIRHTTTGRELQRGFAGLQDISRTGKSHESDLHLGMLPPTFATGPDL
jgi:hypothetical protein